MASDGQPISRRSFLTAGIGAGAVATVSGTVTISTLKRSNLTQRLTHRQLGADPFTLGVASGDPTSDGVVLWTRLALAPANGDGLGGMPDKTVEVRWELATDYGFRRTVRAGTVNAVAAWAHSVHVEVSGLAPDRDYWYRFRAEGHISPVGRTRTAPAAQTLGSGLRMAFSSCPLYEHGYFTAFRRMADDQPDLMLSLGDYPYEYRPGVEVLAGGDPRDGGGPRTITLADYRARHGLYKADPDLQYAHAVAPWLVIWDDHEVENNWADEIPDERSLRAIFPRMRAAAFRAYYENMPLRASSVPNGVDMKIYRRVPWGRLATFHLLDTRQYRDDQACGDGDRSCPAAGDPDRTITGAAQEQWLLDGFRTSRARWDVLGQQVFFAQKDEAPGPELVTNMDGWDGYTASRRRITQGWVDAGVRNAVVLTGDVHAHWASDLKVNYEDPDEPAVGAELVCTSVTNRGDGEDSVPADHPALRLNPHLKFYNNQRGYVLTQITPEQMQADFKVLPYVTRAGAPAYTRATFVVRDQVPGVEETYERPYSKPVTRE